MMPGAIITVKRQPDIVAGAVVLRIDGYLNGKLTDCRFNPYYIVQCVASYPMVNWATLRGSPCRPLALFSQNDDRSCKVLFKKMV